MYLFMTPIFEDLEVSSNKGLENVRDDFLLAEPQPFHLVEIRVDLVDLRENFRNFATPS